MDLPTAADLARIDTRQYAKRQVTWFRNQIKRAAHIDDIEIVSPSNKSRPTARRSTPRPFADALYPRPA
jgi:tRNA A37 N6-isopentenylltransferase MiaA